LTVENKIQVRSLIRTIDRSLKGNERGARDVKVALGGTGDVLQITFEGAAFHPAPGVRTRKLVSIYFHRPFEKHVTFYPSQSSKLQKY